MKFLTRTIESLVYPVGFTWLALLVATIVFHRRKQRGPALFCGILCVFLYVTGATPLPEYLLASLERPHREATVAHAAAADAVIVLGGFMNPSAHDSFSFSVTASADRIISGVEMLRQGKARALVIGGGPLRHEGRPSSEGIRVTHFVRTWNVAPGEVFGLEACLNTRDEAVRTRALMDQHRWTNVVLVTSGFHMSRALATFQKVGITARPVACDFEGLPVVEGEVPSFRVVPIIDHIRALTLYLHEVIGWYYYAARGWV